MLSGQTLTYGGEAAQIGHEHSSPPFFTLNFQSTFLQNRIDDFIREVAAEGLANKPVAQFQGGVEFSQLSLLLNASRSRSRFFSRKSPTRFLSSTGLKGLGK